MRDVIREEAPSTIIFSDFEKEHGFAVRQFTPPGGEAVLLIYRPRPFSDGEYYCMGHYQSYVPAGTWQELMDFMHVLNEHLTMTA